MRKTAAVFGSRFRTRSFPAMHEHLCDEGVRAGVRTQALGQTATMGILTLHVLGGSHAQNIRAAHNAQGSPMGA